MQLDFSPDVDLLDVEELRRQLGTQILGVGERLLYQPVVDSTNTLAMRLAREGSEEGVVVLTDSQTAGKGRLGRRWVDVFGHNVLTSIVLRPLFPPSLLVMVSSLAVVTAIAETCGVAATIKWPNDVLIGERKVAGILIETSHDTHGSLIAVVGIGVNVNDHIQYLTEHLAHKGEDTSETTSSLLVTATTLEMACGHTVCRETYLASLLQHIETDYLALQQDAPATNVAADRPTSRLIWERWRSQLATLGRTIQVRQGKTILDGVAENVDESGALFLRLHSGKLVHIAWGDIGPSAG